jgi:hypothetical protein
MPSTDPDTTIAILRDLAPALAGALNLAAAIARLAAERHTRTDPPSRPRPASAAASGRSALHRRPGEHESSSPGRHRQPGTQ